MEAAAEVGPEERRMLVQWCISAQFFGEDALQAAAARVCGGRSVAVQEAVDAANAGLGPLALALRSGLGQTDGARRWAVVSTSADRISATGSARPPAELAVLRHLVGLVFEADDYAVDLHTAVREAAACGAQPLARREAEALVAALADDGWLDTAAGSVALGPRACIELLPYLSENYPDRVRTCCLCKELATCGVVCAACAAVVHPCCAGRACPACHQRLDNPEPFGPAAPAPAPSRSSGSTPPL